MNAADDDQPLLEASENAFRFREPLREWSDAQLANALTQLERLRDNLAEAMSQIAVERQARLQVYREVVDVIGIGEGGE